MGADHVPSIAGQGPIDRETRPYFQIVPGGDTKHAVIDNDPVDTNTQVDGRPTRRPPRVLHIDGVVAGDLSKGGQLGAIHDDPMEWDGTAAHDTALAQYSVLES